MSGSTKLTSSSDQAAGPGESRSGTALLVAAVVAALVVSVVVFPVGLLALLLAVVAVSKYRSGSFSTARRSAVLALVVSLLFAVLYFVVDAPSTVVTGLGGSSVAVQD